ncbi:MAG: hypothetical protein A2Y00_06655 [Omnitrophica WOR_2 bacterium GWF2_43_52]|nr:MAG: hypothetical protein A2Y00_06655 [Omnitrophica WOR_2 bacterium GWF2_43_52]HAH21688.1 type II secretion system protein GspF [Candidatus Omnitrophota bacterium]HBG64792.1 type II secretion system protein GspF [Candidatus Omnitrophota bacterium]
MPKFIYEAKKGPQEKVTGMLEAKSQSQAIALIEERGLFPVSVEELREKSSALGSLTLKRVSVSDTTLFTRQFSNLIEAGLTISEALKILIQQTTNPALKSIINSISDQIKDGATLSEAFSRYPKQFSQFYCAVVRAGELSGALETVLSRLADFGEQEEKIRSDIIASLAYPALIASVGLLTIYALLSFVVPKITSMFEEMGQALPLATQILIGVSAVFHGYWWLMLLAGATLFFIFKRVKSAEEKLFWDKLMLRVPVVGAIIQKSEMAHFVRTLSLLFESGVAILVALEAVSNTVMNHAIKSEIKKIAQDIKDGVSLSAAMKKSFYFPAYVANIISVGEEAGTLEKSLKRIAVSYEQEISRLMRTLTSLLEPVMILIMGLIVAFIVVSMLLPIFQINLMAR